MDNRGILQGQLKWLGDRWVVDTTIGVSKRFDLCKSDAQRLGKARDFCVYSVDFEIIDEFISPKDYEGIGWGDGIDSAKLIRFDSSIFHFNHCYHGDYSDCCKYGNSDCPAKPDPCPLCGNEEYHLEDCLLNPKKSSSFLLPGSPENHQLQFLVQDLVQLHDTKPEGSAERATINEIIDLIERTYLKK